MNLHEGIPDDLIWKQYGVAIMTQYPETEWERQIERVHEFYRDYIRARIYWKRAARADTGGAT
jgi:hypothetical protein